MKNWELTFSIPSFSVYDTRKQTITLYHTFASYC